MSFGFGSNNNNTSGFGSTNTGGGFGGFGASSNTSTGGSLFGGNTATSGGGGFGTFGVNNTTNSTFRAKIAGGFGAPATTSSGGGLFGAGNTTTASGFGSGGGFGSNSASTGFGAGNNTGGLFGASKPATTGFGASATGGSLFGGNNNTTGGGFGSSNTAANPFASSTNANTGGFGASSTTGGFGAAGAFGASASTPTMSNQGSAAVPFQAFSEKDGATNGHSSYQSLTFQDPYKNQSFEELRTQDYVQGRRFGNSNGQAGSFGTSTGFGGFGGGNTTNATTTGSGLFGATNNAAATGTSGFGGFGNNNAAASNGTSAFGGGNTGGGLFGAKPAGGLFGGAASNAATTGGFGSTSSSGGGLFGNSNTNNTGGFGAANTNTGGGLFGQNNNNNQTNGFGSTASTGGGLFGNNNNQAKPASTGLFGNTANTGSTGGGLFGNNNATNTSGAFGQQTNNTSGGLFGNNNATNNNQQKPAFGGFGASTNTNTSGGLFGGNNNAASTNTGGSLFGQTNNNATGGGLFSANNNQNKSAGGLFGGTTTNTNTGGGLFSGGNTQQGGGLFGGANNNANTNTSSLFGNNQNRPAGNSLFGGNNNNNTNTGSGLSLFGYNSSTQNQNNSSNSLFGSQNNQNSASLFGSNSQQGQSGQLHASLTNAPYGNEQLFSSIGAAASPPLGPLATPLAGARATPKKSQSLLASVRMSTPVYTPRGSSLGRNNTYGFSYSAYGTPGSAYSMSLTPGASTMLKPSGSLSSGLSNRLTKSQSTNDLRGDGLSSQGSLLRPSLLNPGSGRAYGTGSMRKLNIDRSLREDFFGTPKQSETPRPTEERGGGRSVNFDTSADRTGDNTAQPSSANALVRTETEETDDSPQYSRLKRPEMEQVNDSGSTTVNGTSSTAPAESKSQGPGPYFTIPAIEQLKKMSRQQLQKMGVFTVGRPNVGRIEFGPCDLSSVVLDDICERIVQLEVRAATVYPEPSSKPAVGIGLNVPSTIHLEHSWPRNRAMRHAADDSKSPAYQRHLEKLKKMRNTKFVDYNSATGVWSFSVEHFTTYGLDDDDEELPMEAESSSLSDVPTTSPQEGETTMQSIEIGSGEVDDTFEFKLDRSSVCQPPGGFGISYDYDDPSADEEMTNGQDYTMPGALGDFEDERGLTWPGGPVQAVSPLALAQYQATADDIEVDEEEDAEQEMPGSFVEEPKMPRSILKPSMGLGAFISPEKLVTEAWEEQLQRTMSPKKRDRQALKEMQQTLQKAKGRDDGFDSPFKQSLLGQSLLNQSYLAQKSAKKGKLGASTLGGDKSQAFRTSMDIMNSLWENEKTAKKAGASGKGFEYPYSKKSRLSSSEDLTEQDIAFHDTMKPSFAADGTLVYSAPGSAPQVSGEAVPALRSLVGEHKDVRFARFVPPKDLVVPMLELQQMNSSIIVKDEGFPVVEVSSVQFLALADEACNGDAKSALTKQESAVWGLCSVLFDDLNVAGAHFMDGVPEELREELEPRIKLDTFAAFWAKLVAFDAEKGIQSAKTPDERALLLLTQNKVEGACEALIAGRNFKLAMLVAQLSGAGDASRHMMRMQIKGWQERKDWSEMSDAVRALFSIIAGEVCVVEGQNGAAEDKASQFCISERFGLSWQQSFALRLFFGGHADLNQVITAYTQDLTKDRESVLPITLWDTVDKPNDTDVFAAEREDTVMSLLRLSVNEVDVAGVFDASIISGSSLNSRLAWQMATLLQSRQICELPKSTIDDLTLSFSAELETTAQNIVMAAWVLLHLADPETRLAAIKGLLDRNAALITTPDSDKDLRPDAEELSNFTSLTSTLYIPVHMIYAARAPLAKSHGDDARQVFYLLQAHHACPNRGFDLEAQEVLCATVGPDAVIAKDYAALRKLLPLFTANPGNLVQGWHSGAGVYNDFLRLLVLKNGREREAAGVVQALRKSLMAIEDGGSSVKLRQRVAVLEMRRVCEEMGGKVVGRGGGDVEMKLGDSGREMFGSDVWAGYKRAMGVVV